MSHDGDEPPPLYAVPDDRDRERPQPADHQAEKAVLGAMLLSATAVEAVGDVLYGTEFDKPNHELIYHAIIATHLEGHRADMVTVAAHLEETGNLRRAGGAPYLHTLASNVPTTENAAHYANIVADRAARRRLVQAGTRIRELGYATGNDLATTTNAAATTLAKATAEHTTTTGLTAQNIHDFLATTDPDHAWLIPGLLERGDRLILTSGEGHGKSTLMRQIAVQAAAGTHPFTLTPCPPIRVLLVDLENSARQTRRKIHALTVAAGPTLQPHNLHIVCKVDGLDLTQPTDQTWLSHLVKTTKADLLITGPIYKLAAGNPNDEKDAKPAAMALDKIRADHDCAIVLEAHTAKTPAGITPKNRPKEPYGWSGWLRWPEFGLHLAEDGTLSHWRGAREEGRDFPEALNRGGKWPWTPDTTESRAETDMRWQQIKRAIEQSGKQMSEREIAQATDLNKSTVHRVLGIYSMQYQGLLSRLGREEP